MTQATADVMLAEESAPKAAGRRNRGLLLRRIGFYLIAAWSAITLNFLIPRAMPGSPPCSTACCRR